MKSPRQLAAAVVRRVVSPFVPDLKRLPFLYFLDVLGGGCGPDLAQVDKFFAGTGVAIDVGANEGLFTYRFSKSFRQVHSFEINTDLAEPITRYNPGNIKLYPFGLSSEPRTLRFYLPVLDGVPLVGWGSLNRDNCPGAQSFIERDVLVKRLDDFGFAEVDFIKIDVEGHEVEVIKGAAATIETSRPVLLMEVRNHNLPAVNSWFEARDFRQISLARVFQLAENENYLYVPAEKLGQLRIKDGLPEWAAAGQGA
jgi:FkbM family methyltransferase